MSFCAKKPPEILIYSRLMSFCCHSFIVADGYYYYEAGDIFRDGVENGSTFVNHEALMNCPRSSVQCAALSITSPRAPARPP